MYFCLLFLFSSEKCRWAGLLLPVRRARQRDWVEFPIFAADQSRIGEMWTASKKLAVLAVSHVGDSPGVKVKKSCATIHQ